MATPVETGVNIGVIGAILGAAWKLVGSKMNVKTVAFRFVDEACEAALMLERKERQILEVKIAGLTERLAIADSERAQMRTEMDSLRIQVAEARRSANRRDHPTARRDRTDE